MTLDKNLGIAVVSAGIIGGVCYKFRKKIINSLRELIGAISRAYAEYDDKEYKYYYTKVRGHWKFDQYGNLTYVRPHYRRTKKRRY